MLNIFFIMSAAIVILLVVSFYRTYLAKREWQVKVQFRIRHPIADIYRVLLSLEDHPRFAELRKAAGGSLKLEAKAQHQRVQYSAPDAALAGGSVSLEEIPETEAVRVVWRHWGSLNDSISRRTFAGGFKRQQKVAIQHALANIVEALDNGE